MDLIDRLIELAQIHGRADIQCSLQGNWHIRHEAHHTQALVHIVTKGQGWLAVDEKNQTINVKVGDVVFFPRISAHVLSSHEACQNITSASNITEEKNGAFTLKQNSSQPEFEMFCAHFEYENHAALLSSLPDIILLDMADTPLAQWVGLMKNEATQTQNGSTSILDALSKILLVLLIRAYINQADQLPIGWLNGWLDKRLRGVIEAVLAQPDDNWTIQSMLDIANLSRAQLMRLFKKQTGISPYHFVATVRLQKAALLLKTTQDNILTIALSTGFQSESHFGKAFKQAYGLTPKQYRQQNLKAV